MGEEIEDVATSVKAADPLLLTSIHRPLGGAVFRGKVVDIEQGARSRTRFYRVEYDDGDIEHFTEQQVKDMAVPDNPSSPTTDSDAESDSDDVDDAILEAANLAVRGRRVSPAEFAAVVARLQASRSAS